MALDLSLETFWYDSNVPPGVLKGDQLNALKVGEIGSLLLNHSLSVTLRDIEVFIVSFIGVVADVIYQDVFGRDVEAFIFLTFNILNNEIIM